MKTLAAQERAQDETRRKIIQAAGEVFSEFGYHAATTREICARAEVNIAAVNYHFRDKLGLYTEILETAVSAQQLPGVASALACSKPEDALRLFLQSMFHQFTDPDRPAWYVRVMIHELASPTPGLQAVVEHVIRPKATILCGIVGKIIHRPALDVQTRLCAHSIMGQVVHYVHARPVIELLWPDWKRTPEALAEVVNHITEFSLAALREIAEGPHPTPKRKRMSK